MDIIKRGIEKGLIAIDDEDKKSCKI